MKYIASVSFGKDSLAMLLLLLEKHKPLDEVIFYDTGMEFAAIYDIRDAILPLLKNRGILYTELHPAYDFEYQMMARPVQGRKGGTHCGYSWCGGRCRWGTTDKLRALEYRCVGACEYVGIASDETERLKKERKGHKVFPLAEWGKTEANCLLYCYDRGFEWREHGANTPDGTIRLYDILDRVSCWCCANKNLRELRKIYRYLPDYWERLKQLQAKTVRPMKGPGKSVFDLEKRFELESERITAGLSITSHDFYAELAGRLVEERTNL